MNSRVGPSTKAEYRYNGLGQRVAYKLNGTGTWYDLVQDEQWREVAVYDRTNNKLLERTLFHNAGLNGRGGSSYIDSAAIRETTPSTPSGGNPPVMQTRWYTLQNWRADVVATLASNGTLTAWASYTAYGKQDIWRVADVDDGTGNGVPDGGVTIDDELLYLAWFDLGDLRADVDDGNGTGVRDGGLTTDDLLYFLDKFELGTAEADMTNDGGVTIDDLLLYEELFEAGGPATLSRVMYAGYQYDAKVDLYHVRFRVYSTDIGRWLTIDPLEYVDGNNLWFYVDSSPVALVDSLGLSPGTEVIDWFKDLGRGAKRVGKGLWYGGRSLCGDRTADAYVYDHSKFDMAAIELIYNLSANLPTIAGGLGSLIHNYVGMAPPCVVNGILDSFGTQIVQSAAEWAGSKLVISGLSGLATGRTRSLGRSVARSAGVFVTCTLYTGYGKVEQLQARAEALQISNPTLYNRLEQLDMTALYGVAPTIFDAMIRTTSQNADTLMSIYCTAQEIQDWKNRNSQPGCTK